MCLISSLLLVFSFLCFTTSYVSARRHVRHTVPITVLRSQLTPFAASDECHGDDWGTAGTFDLYVLAQSWSAQFCSSSSHRNYPGCKKPTAWQRTNLTLHGLWPQYTNETGGHGWPQCCTSSYGSALNQSVVTAALTQLQQYWPNEEQPSGTPLTSTLWYHEWAAHGTCSALPQSTYIHTALSLTQQLTTPALIIQHIGSSVSRTALESAYNGGKACGSDSCMVWLQCEGGYLSEVHTCWSKAGKKVVCPKLVVSESGKCTGSQISIRKFA